MNDQLEKRASSAMDKVLPEMPPAFETQEQLITYVKGCEGVRKQVNQAIDYSIGKALCLAKQSLPHGNFTNACDIAGYPERHARRLMDWFKTAYSADISARAAEMKMSAHGREALCRAQPETLERVAELVADPEVKKVTAAQVKDIDTEILQVMEGFANVAQYEAEEAEKELSFSDKRAQWALAKTAEIWDDEWNEMNEALVTKDEACKLVHFWKGRAETSHYGRQMDRIDSAWEKNARHIDVVKNRIPKLSATEKEELLQLLMKDTSVTIHPND